MPWAPGGLGSTSGSFSLSLSLPLPLVHKSRLTHTSGREFQDIMSHEAVGDPYDSGSEIDETPEPHLGKSQSQNAVFNALFVYLI